MNKLTQKQKLAKKAYLNKQQSKMLDRYIGSDSGERQAIINHIDSFLEVTPEDSQTFWLEFREKLIKLNHTKN